jgi:hypothetical protein
VISDMNLTPGKAIQIGEHVATIVDASAEPEIIAFLPSKDRPRLKVGQTLQVELVGYKKTRELATITYLTNEAVGAAEAARLLGQTQADAVKLPPGSYVMVKAKLPRTFKSEEKTLYFHHGMLAVTEVKIRNQPFLVSLFPALEKYIPD